jgi:Thioredoxin-like
METWVLVKPMDRTCTACGDGSLFAVELRTPGWSPLLRLPENSLGASPRGKTAFDGIDTRSFGMGGSFVSRSLGMGGSFIKTGFDPGNPSETDADDFWLAFLPSDSRFTGLVPTKFRVLSDDARIGEIPCILVETGNAALSHTLLWLDPAREDVVLRKQRYAMGLNGWSVERADFSYRGHADNGWIPADWKKSVVGPDGTISVASTDTVAEFRINQPIPHAEFKVELPATEYVEDKDSQVDREAKAREAAAAVFVERWAKPVAKKPKTPPIYDPQFDALADVDSALNTARATGKRVLIEFGGQGHPDCGKLYNSLRGHAELSARLRQGFELVLVDTDYPDAGQIVYKKYVPSASRKRLPALCVLNPDGTVRHIDDTAGLKSGDDYDVDLLKAFLEKWSRRK